MTILEISLTRFLLRLCLGFFALTSTANAIDVDRELQSAARGGYVERIKDLIDRGANIASANGAGRNALMLAAAYGNLGAARVLLTEGVDSNVVDAAGLSALMLAAMGGHENMVKLLVERGADLELASQAQLTAVTYARKAKREDIAKQLIDAGAKDPDAAADKNTQGAEGDKKAPTEAEKKS